MRGVEGHSSDLDAECLLELQLIHNVLHLAYIKELFKPFYLSLSTDDNQPRTFAIMKRTLYLERISLAMDASCLTPVVSTSFNVLHESS